LLRKLGGEEKEEHPSPEEGNLPGQLREGSKDDSLCKSQNASLLINIRRKHQAPIGEGEEGGFVAEEDLPFFRKPAGKGEAAPPEGGKGGGRMKITEEKRENASCEGI